jgi:uncharacterized protein (TIGR03086 family)
MTVDATSTSTESPAHRLERALEATGLIVAGIRADQWSNPTPCTEWDARTLLNHLVGGNRLFAGVLLGAALPPLEERKALFSADQLGDDPVRAYQKASAHLLSAFGQPGVLERPFDLPIGRVPGAVALQIRLTEALVHGWDLARATGQTPRLPEDLAEEALSFASGAQAPQVPRTGHPFGPVQPVAADAPAIDRLAGYLGRPVATT